MRFFKGKAPAPAASGSQDNLSQAQPQQPGQGRPTGQFSPKRIRALVITAIVLVLFFMISVGQKPKPKNSSQQQGQDAAANSVNPNGIGTRDYGNAVNQTLKQPPGLPQQYPGFGQAPNSDSYPTSTAPDQRFVPGSYPQYAAGTFSPTSPASYPPNAATGYAAPYRQGSYSPTSAPSGSGGTIQQQRDPQLEAREAMQAGDDKREHDSLAATLIIRSERLHAATPTPIASSPTQTQPPVVPAGQASSSTVAPPFATGGNTGMPAGTHAPAPPPPTQAAGAASNLPEDLPSRGSRAPRRDQTSSNRATGPAYKLFEGTLIESVLTNRLNSSYTGPVECMVTTDVWSHSREHLLIPQGTKALGEARRVTQLGQDRLAVVFHRLVMPDGFSVSLDNFTGLNQIGETGLNDKVNHHYVQIFGVSVALGAISGLAARAANVGFGTTQSGSEALRQGFSQQLSQEGTQILDRFLNVLPTVTIREGVRVKVYLLDDLSLPAYDQHRMATDL